MRYFAPLMSEMGQKPNPPGTVACQLSPAPDNRADTEFGRVE
jgi:hypothetical protein